MAMKRGFFEMKTSADSQGSINADFDQDAGEDFKIVIKHWEVLWKFYKLIIKDND